jgi:5-methylthioadenosine/S-adenosylhomocysteine deaminase
MAAQLINGIEWLITVDRDRRIIQNASILIEDGIITAVGKASTLSPPAGAEMIDGRGLFGLPGLIDSSVAPIQQLGRGLGDFCDIPKYRLERVAAYEAALTAEDAICAARSCMLEMIESGTTCFVDTGSRFPNQVADAAVDLGLRAVIGRSCQDIFETPMGDAPLAQTRETAEESLSLAQKTVQQIRNRAQQLLTAAITIPWLAGCSDQLLGRLAQLAEKEKLPIVVSAAASRDEAVMARMHHKKTELARVDDAKLLGPRTLVSHAGWTSPHDLRRICDKGATAVCCPSSSHRLGTGALENGRFPELLAFGANLALGSGSAMGSNFIDVARQLYLFSGGNKTFRLDATITSPETTLEMATIRAAKALGLDDRIGSVEVGKQADIAFFRCSTVDWVPLINPLQNLVFSARSGADTVIVAGKVLLRGGKLCGGGEEQILAECQERAKAIASRAGLMEFCKPAWNVI